MHSIDTPAKLVLKKRAVKVVGSTAPSSPVAEPFIRSAAVPVNVEPKQVDGPDYQPVPAMPKTETGYHPKHTEPTQWEPTGAVLTSTVPDPTMDFEDALDAYFVRTAMHNSSPAASTPALTDSIKKDIPPVTTTNKQKHDKLQEEMDAADSPDKALLQLKLSGEPIRRTGAIARDAPVSPSETPLMKPYEQVNLREARDKYIEKAGEYTLAIPTTESSSVRLIQEVIQRLRRVDPTLNDQDCWVLNESGRKYGEEVFERAKAMPGGIDFLVLFAKLVDDSVLTKLEDYDEIVTLCLTIIAMLSPKNGNAPPGPTAYLPSPYLHAEVPTKADNGETTKEEPVAESMANLSKEVDSARDPAKHHVPVDQEQVIATDDSLKKEFDPMDNMAAWPKPEKREKVGNRTVSLKGLSSINTLNKLQSLVWGGKVEALAFQPGNDSALVKFLTAEGCQKYFDATENGVSIEDNGKKRLVTVERSGGPNSANDVVKNCIENGITRCVRVIDIDDWSEDVLKDVAAGAGKNKRQVDTIVRGKTVGGRPYVEFRFSSIYDALNFKHRLIGDEEWEHCTIVSAADPCEVATGVHFKSAAEEANSF